MRKGLDSRLFRIPAGLALGTVLFGSLAVIAAPAPPAPPPAPQLPPAAPTAPAVNPTAPGAPAPSGETAAKARAAAVAAKANIDISEAWTRTTTGKDAQVFLKIASVKDADKLIGIDVATADKAQIADPAAKTTVEMLDIPAGQTIDFKPGGRHLELTGLKAPLKEGESFLISFKFEKAGTEAIPVKVLASSANGLPPVGSTRKGDTTAAVTQREKTP